MSFIQQIKNATKRGKNPQTKYARVMENIKSRIENAAEDGQNSLKTSFTSWNLSEQEERKLIGVLRRMKFKVERNFDFNTRSSYWLISW